ncbi:MAG: YraN family protein [Rickettsiaceae bacterium]|nr:MAG: YraN family protein [Rickettsiaceae bacterium]
MSNNNLGLIAEYIVLILYKLKLYKIINHRMRNWAGEIDLITQRGKQLVFVEVKARTSNFDTKFISHQQQRRIKNAAQVFLLSNVKYNNFDVRFDLVIVRPFQLPEIIENAW